MTDRRFKKIAISVTTLIILVIITTVGVWAAVQTTASIGTQISFTATGVKGELYAYLDSDYLNSATHTLGGIDIGGFNTNQNKPPLNIYYGGHIRGGTYIGAYDYGGGFSQPNMTLIFSFADHDSDGLATDEQVWLWLCFKNTGENRAQVSVTSSGTSNNVNVETFIEHEYQGNSFCNENDFLNHSVSFAGEPDFNPAIFNNTAEVGIKFTPKVNTTFTNDSSISINITISKYVAP